MHAYATTRIFVSQMWKLRKMDMHGWFKTALSHKLAYDIGIFLSSTLMLGITFDMNTVIVFCAVWLAARTAWLRVKGQGGNATHGLRLVENDRCVMVSFSCSQCIPSRIVTVESLGYAGVHAKVHACVRHQWQSRRHRVR